MGECSETSCLPFETHQRLGIVCEIGRQNFQRDVAPETLIVRTPDNPHSALAELFDELVDTKSLPDACSGDEW